jgi:hypothetical protein
MVVYVWHERRDIPGTDAYLVVANADSPDAALRKALETHDFLGKLEVMAWDSRPSAVPVPLTDDDVHRIACGYAARERRRGGRRWPRRGAPWTAAEDRHLRLLVTEALAKYPGATMWTWSIDGRCPAHEVAQALGRTPSSVQTRYCALELCKHRREMEATEAIRRGEAVTAKGAVA